MSWDRIPCLVYATESIIIWRRPCVCLMSVALRSSNDRVTPLSFSLSVCHVKVREMLELELDDNCTVHDIHDFLVFA